VNREELIPKHGGFRRLVTYQLATVIYDVTVRFCIRYIDRRSRTHDQMVQAGAVARGGPPAGRADRAAAEDGRRLRGVG
jgi:hypothetical protein